MAISKDKLHAVLSTAFPQGNIECRDLAGDEDHWEVAIQDSIFAGKSLIAQHKMVQNVLKSYAIHALSIKTTS